MCVFAYLVNVLQNFFQKKDRWKDECLSKHDLIISNQIITSFFISTEHLPPQYVKVFARLCLICNLSNAHVNHMRRESHAKCLGNAYNAGSIFVRRRRGRSSSRWPGPRNNDRLPRRLRWSCTVSRRRTRPTGSPRTWRCWSALVLERVPQRSRKRARVIQGRSPPPRAGWTTPRGVDRVASSAAAFLLVAPPDPRRLATRNTRERETMNPSTSPLAAYTRRFRLRLGDAFARCAPSGRRAESRTLRANLISSCSREPSGIVNLSGGLGLLSPLTVENSIISELMRCIIRYL